MYRERQMKTQTGTGRERDRCRNIHRSRETKKVGGDRDRGDSQVQPERQTDLEGSHCCDSWAPAL